MYASSECLRKKQHVRLIRMFEKEVTCIPHLSLFFKLSVIMLES